MHKYYLLEVFQEWGMGDKGGGNEFKNDAFDTL
jgi:hypothetical protein